MTMPSTVTIVPSASPKRTPRTVTPPLQGIQARELGRGQGHIWQATHQHAAIGERVETIDRIDARGDALMAAHRRHLARAQRMALREGAPQTAAMLAELIASAALLAEIDDAEDSHRREIDADADDGERAGRAANAVCMLLLGQKEAAVDPAEPADLAFELPYPLDAPGRGACGREREPMGTITFQPCPEPAGHELGGGVCVFMAVGPKAVTP